MSERALARIGGLITVLTILASVLVAIETKPDVQIGILLTLVTVVLSLGFTAFALIREQLAQLDRRRFGALPLQPLLGLPMLEPPVVRMVEQCSTVAEHRSPFMLGVAVEAVEAAAAKVAGIADGTVVCAQDDEYALVHRALEQTRERVRAIAARGTAWWETPEADVYWRLYEQAAKRLKITRVFLTSSHEDEDRLERVLNRHRRAGMETYVLSCDRVPPNRRRPIVIFDDGLIHKSYTSQEDQVGAQVLFTDRETDVSEAEAAFETILGLARDVTEERRPVRSFVSLLRPARPQREH